MATRASHILNEAYAWRNVSRWSGKKLVTQGLEIYFKYSGQPMSCYRCSSTEHMVRKCPRQRRASTTAPHAPESGGDTDQVSTPRPTPQRPWTSHLFHRWHPRSRRPPRHLLLPISHVQPRPTQRSPRNYFHRKL